MALIKCKECGHEISDEALACPNCGKPQKDKPLSISLSRQVVVYSVSLFLPPLGLWYAWKYLKQKDGKSKKIGITSLILTIISTIFTVWFTGRIVNSINQTLNSINISNYWDRRRGPSRLARRGGRFFAYTELTEMVE